MFKFKGISSTDMQVIIEEEEHFIARAAKRYETIEIEGRDGAIFNELGYSYVERPIYVQCLNIDKIDDILAWLDGEGEFEYRGRKTTARFYSELEPKREGYIRIIDTTFIRDPFWIKANEEFVTVKESKVTETEESKSIHVEDASTIGQLEVLGNHEQDEESSPNNPVEVKCLGSNKNLLNTSLILETTKGGITSKINSDGSITFNGTCTADNNVFDFFIENQTKFMFKAITKKTAISAFYVSGNITDENNEGAFFRICDSNYNGGNIDLTSLPAEKIMTHIYNSTSGSVFCDIRIEKNAVLDNFTIKLKAANTLEDALTYSPYGQGCTKISNTNENFLDLINAKTNEATYTFQNDVLTVKSSSPGGYNKIYIDLLELFKKNPGKTIIFKFEKLDISKYNSTSNGIVQIQYTKNNVSDYPTIVAKDGSRYEFNIPEDVTGITTAILNIFANNTNKYVQSSISITKPMLLLRKLSENKIEYVEHKQEDYLLYIQQEMLKGDYFVKEDDGWKGLHGWNKLDLTGNENFYQSKDGEFYRYSILMSDALLASARNIVYSNCYTSNKINESKENLAYIYDGYIYLYSTLSSTEDFKQMLADKYNAGNPVYVFYKSATPTKLPCTKEQSAVLEELNNLDLFEGVNNIITAEDISLLKLKYMKITDEKINNEGNVESRPILRLEKTSTESVELTINNCRFKYNFNDEEYVEIDCEEKTALYEGLNRNRQIEIDYEFPILNVGDNDIKMHSGDCVIKVLRKDRWL